MPIPATIERVVSYWKRHGASATVRRLGVSLRQATQNRLVIYACDLATLNRHSVDKQKLGSVERRAAMAELAPEELAQMESHWHGPVKGRWQQRFERQALLWLFKADGKIAGYGWTIVGHTIEPHYFPLSAGDVHLFDFFVFPEFRGRRINPCLVNNILAELALERKSRAFIEAAEWNSPQLSSLNRTDFKPIGKAWKRCLFGKTVVVWSP